MGKFSEIINNIWPDTQAVFRRFPIAALMVGAFATILLIEANANQVFNDEMMMRLIGGTILAAYLSVILTLVGEGRGKPVSLWIKVLACALALICSYFFRELSFLIPAAIGAAILFLGSAPFWRQERNDVGVWDFTHKLWTAVIFTVAGSVIYVAGIFAISAALKSLFSLNISDFVEDWLLPIGLGFLAPICWMAMLPRHDEDDSDSLRNPGFISKAVGFLGTWILAPLTLIYAAILIAYGIKIVLTQTLPNGEIAQLVTPFLIIGTLTWLILDPPFIQKKRIARWFSKIWFPLIIPAALLLAVAVFIRIGEYGWTIERYLLVLASVWALGIALWFTFRPESKRDIRIIPGFAALLLAIGSIGPWGADQFSAISQNARLEQALNANNMLNASGKLKTVSEMEVETSPETIKAKGALDYLINQKKINAITSYIPDEEEVDFVQANARRKSLKQANILKRFGLEDVRMPNRYRGPYDHYNYFDNAQTFDISGFEKMVTGQNVNLNPKGTYETNMSIGSYTIVSQGSHIRVKYNGQTLSDLDAVNWLDNLETLAVNKLNLDPRKILYSSGETEIAVHIINAHINKGDENSENASAGMQFMILGKGTELEPAIPNP